jgi:hypothetical protein
VCVMLRALRAIWQSFVVPLVIVAIAQVNGLGASYVGLCDGLYLILESAINLLRPTAFVA